MPVDPDAGIPDLVRKLGADSKRLLAGEVRLAKLEVHDDVERAGKGAMWLGIALGMGIVAMVGFTLFVATLIGRVLDGHMWVGALVAAVLDLALAAVLIKRAKAAFSAPSYSLEQTRAALH
jgi:uncharacterized membrane protein YqjE